MKDTYLTTGKKEDCCGCTACKSICEQGAISMQADEQGFCTRKSIEKSA